MKAKALIWKWSDNSGGGVARVYLENDFEQGEKDFKLLKSHSDKEWSYVDVEVYGTGNKTPPQLFRG